MIKLRQGRDPTASLRQSMRARIRRDRPGAAKRFLPMEIQASLALVSL
jgi:hypothetical protein